MNTSPPISRRLSQLGTLAVRVVTAGGAFPVEGADVRIGGATEENAAIHYLLTTDGSGLAERIDLPTPEAALSQSPGNPPGFASYVIEIFKAGYYPLVFRDVPLFPGVTSLQLGELIPKPPYVPEKYPPTEETDFTEYEPLEGGARRA